MGRFRRGAVVLTEGNRKSLISKLIAWTTGSWWTHAFIITGPNLAVEATFPRVKEFSLNDRIRELETNDRAYVVLDLDGITTSDRFQLARVARSFIGKFYDVGQLLLYKLTGRFWNDGPGTVVCSRTITAVYDAVFGTDDGDSFLFPDEVVKEKFPPDSAHTADIQKGFVRPADLCSSRLVVSYFRPSSTISRVN